MNGIDQLVLEYNSGLPVKEIGIKYNLPISTVYAYIKGKVTKHKINRSDKHTKVTNDQVEQILVKFNSGIKVTELAKEYSLSRMAIYNIINKHNKTRDSFLTPYLSNKQLFDYPPIYAQIDNLSIVVLDPKIWNVKSIMGRLNIKHGVAYKLLGDFKEYLKESFDYNLLMLWEDELTLPGLEAMIKHRTTNATRSCSARECEVVQVNKITADDFYNKWHLQGGCNSRISYGLTYNKELVACMSFNNSTICRGTTKGHLLQRFAVAGSVPGAAGKLLAAFRKTNSGSIVTYADMRYATGNMYETLGFTVETVWPPDYKYWRDNQWYSKNSKQKKFLWAEMRSQGLSLPEDTTEFELAEYLDYLRCYDCGKITYTLN